MKESRPHCCGAVYSLLPSRVSALTRSVICRRATLINMSTPIAVKIISITSKVRDVIKSCRHSSITRPMPTPMASLSLLLITVV